MAKQIVILTKKDYTDYYEATYLYWLSVPVGQQVLRANPYAVSAYAGATTAEVDAIKAGQVAEKLYTTSFLNGTPVNQIKTMLVNGYAAEQMKLNGEDQWQFFGSFYDGATWTIQGV